jgi:dihydropyrimidinase
MIDLVVRGGQVVTPWGVGDWDVAVQGEKIVAVAAPGTLPANVGRVLDATGRIVVPGGIEPHSHVAMPIWTSVTGHPHVAPARPMPPPAETAPPAEASRSALFGGTTTITDFAHVTPSTDIFAAIEERNSHWRGNSYCDYSYHLMMLGDLPHNIIGQVPETIQQGFPTFKIFTTDILPASRIPPGVGWQIGMGHLTAMMEQVAANGGLMTVHSEDDDMVQYNYRKLEREERTEWFNIHEVHTNVVEDVSFRRVLRVAEWTGAAVYFVHVSAKEGVDAIREARGRGLPIYGETLHNYACFNADDYKKPDGMKYHTYPSLKSEEDRKALWDGLIKGGLNSMGTDEFCSSYAVKTQGKSINDITGGHNGTEARMGITYSVGVGDLGMSLQRFVDVTSANAARIMGYYPRKGAIAPGSDADIVLINPSMRRKLTLKDLHISDYSIWEGWPIKGWPVTTILRGKVVVENGRFSGTPGAGQLIPRKIDADILKRPAC